MGPWFEITLHDRAPSTADEAVPATRSETSDSSARANGIGGVCRGGPRRRPHAPPDDLFPTPGAATVCGLAPVRGALRPRLPRQYWLSARGPDQHRLPEFRELLFRRQ